MIKKVFLLFLLIGLLVFLLVNRNKRLSTFHPKKQVNLSRPLPEVKDKKIIDEIARENIDSKEELREKFAKVSARDLECKNNDHLFKTLDLESKNLQTTIDDFFQKAIVRPSAEIFYQKLMEILESKKNVNIEVVFGVLRTLEICRFPYALAFLDKVIESKILKTSKLLRKLNNDLLGYHFSSINLALVFGKLSKISQLRLIKSDDYQQIGELKERFLKSEKDFTENLNKIENLTVVRDLTIEHLEELKDLGMVLKGELENLSKD